MPAQADNHTWILLPAKTKPRTGQASPPISMASPRRPAAPRGCCRCPRDAPAGKSARVFVHVQTQPHRRRAGHRAGAGDFRRAAIGPGVTMDSPPDFGTNQLDLSRAHQRSARARPGHRRNEPDRHQRRRQTPGHPGFLCAISSRTACGRGRRNGSRANTPLTRFLLTSRSGHCEYFATATVLLLRQLGIPARYAVGYYVHEPAGSGYVVRERDAHAWCLAWNRQTGSWDDFDTTPASWVAIEGAQRVVLGRLFGRAFLADLAVRETALAAGEPPPIHHLDACRR